MIKALLVTFVLLLSTSFLSSAEIDKNPTTVQNRIAELNAPKEGHVDSDPNECWYELKQKIDEDIGLKFGLFYSPMMQTFLPHENKYEAAGGTFNIDAYWNLLGRNTCTPGYLVFRAQDRHRYNSVAPAALFLEDGSLWPSTVGYNEFNLSVVELAWEQHIVKDRFVIKFGRTPPFANHDYFRFKSPFNGFNDATFTFNPTIAYTTTGLAIGFGLRPQEDFYILAGLHDANGKIGRSGFDTFFKKGEFLTIVDLGWDPGFVNPKHAVCFGRWKVSDIHVTLWHKDRVSDADEPEGWGATFFAEGEIDNLVTFLRVGYSTGTDNGPAILNGMVAGGFVVLGPFGYKDDKIGVGLSWGKRNVGTIDTGFDDIPSIKVGDVSQLASEIFYDMQLTRELLVCPHVQFVFDPALNPDRDVVSIFGLRILWGL